MKPDDTDQSQPSSTSPESAQPEEETIQPEITTPREPTPGEQAGDRNVDQGGPIPTGEAAVRAGETQDDRNLLQKAEDKVRSVLDDTQP